jgi:hypothetical protein
MLNLELEREVKNRADWEKSIKAAKVCIGLWCQLWQGRKGKEDKKKKELRIR